MLAYRRAAALIVLVPALALAAPRGRKPKAGAKPPTTKPAEPKPAEPTPKPDEPKPDEPAADSTRDREPAKDADKDKAPQPAPATPASGAAATGGGEQPAPQAEPDVDTLRQEYLTLRDELFKSSARASAVASQLYSTRITVRLTWTATRFYGVTRSSIRLDGANVYENTGGAIAGDDGVRFDGYVAPGRHLVTFHVEASGKDDDTFASTTETQIVVKAVAGKDLVVAAKARDGGDIAYEWKRHERGSYGLAIDVAVKAQAPADGDGKKAAKK